MSIVWINHSIHWIIDSIHWMIDWCEPIRERSEMRAKMRVKMIAMIEMIEMQIEINSIEMLAK
jgi:hypothetical protein